MHYPGGVWGPWDYGIGYPGLGYPGLGGYPYPIIVVQPPGGMGFIQLGYEITLDIKIRRVRDDFFYSPLIFQ